VLDPLRFSHKDQEEIISRVLMFDIDIEKLAKIEKVIDDAKHATRVPEARLGLIIEWVWYVLYGDLTVKQKNEIDIHLKDMVRAYSCFMGSEVTPSERQNYKLYCEEKTIEITRIHAGFGNSIKIQID
jgi:hypothetical protein